MSFLNPIMLAGLAAVSVPIIIHLLNRRKFQKVVWAAMRFLNVSVERNQRRMRIEDMILLALRCLLLALLALALARPALLSEGTDVFGQAKVTGVVILDNSYSMGMSDGVRTRFDKAREAAEAAIDSMPAGSATAVILASDVAQGVIPEPTFDLNLARKTVREAPLTDRATDLFPALNQALTTLRERLALRKEIFVVTDGQATGWKQLADIQTALEKNKSEIKTHLILVNEHEEKNLGLSELRLASGLSPVNQPLRFEVRVTNYGREEVRDVRVSLSVDAEPAGDEFTIDAIAPGASRSVSLFAKLREPGFHALRARLPEDRLAADDSRSLVVRTIKEARVLLVDGEPGAEPRDEETYFLEQALTPVPPELRSSYFIKTATITAPELSLARLDNYDAVILANVPDCSEATLKNLEQYLRRGGGLMVFTGGRINLTFYNEQLFRRFHFLPAQLEPPTGDPAQDQVYVNLQEKDYDHPMVSIWNDPASGTLGSARFFRRHPLKLEPIASPASAPTPTPGPVSSEESPPSKTEEAGEPRVVLKYADGVPAVVEHTWGLGRVILFGSTADTAWNDLPVRLSFVPLLHRALGSIVQRQDEGLNLRVGEAFTRRVQPEYLGKDATVFKPRQVDAIRDLRRIEIRDGWPALHYDHTELAGVYEASVVDPPLTLRFAAQADPAESSLDEISPAQLSTLKNVATVIDWTPHLSLRNLVEKERSGIEFWLPIVIAALLLAAAETFLGQWFSRSK
jgi:Aerotolerance regulator N-terminal/von Willebrand factor type A domain/CARDB